MCVDGAHSREDSAGSLLSLELKAATRDRNMRSTCVWEGCTQRAARRGVSSVCNELFGWNRIGWERTSAAGAVAATNRYREPRGSRWPLNAPLYSKRDLSRTATVSDDQGSPTIRLILLFGSMTAILSYRRPCPNPSLVTESEPIMTRKQFFDRATFRFSKLTQ